MERQSYLQILPKKNKFGGVNAIPKEEEGKTTLNNSISSRVMDGLCDSQQI
jgi:hypothetical protein